MMMGGQFMTEEGPAYKTMSFERLRELVPSVKPTALRDSLKRQDRVIREISPGFFRLIIPVVFSKEKANGVVRIRPLNITRPKIRERFHLPPLPEDSDV